MPFFLDVEVIFSHLMPQKSPTLNSWLWLSRLWSLRLWNGSTNWRASWMVSCPCSSTPTVGSSPIKGSTQWEPERTATMSTCWSSGSREAWRRTSEFDALFSLTHSNYFKGLEMVTQTLMWSMVLSSDWTLARSRRRSGPGSLLYLSGPISLSDLADLPSACMELLCVRRYNAVDCLDYTAEVKKLFIPPN